MFDYISWFTEWRKFNDLLKIMAYVVLFLQRFSNTFEFQNKNNIIDFSNLVICSNSWLYPKFDLANCGRSIDTYYSQFFFSYKIWFSIFLDLFVHVIIIKPLNIIWVTLITSWYQVNWSNCALKCACLPSHTPENQLINLIHFCSIF